MEARQEPVRPPVAQAENSIADFWKKLAPDVREVPTTVGTEGAKIQCKYTVEDGALVIRVPLTVAYDDVSRKAEKVKTADGKTRDKISATLICQATPMDTAQSPVFRLTQSTHALLMRPRDLLNFNVSLVVPKGGAVEYEPLTPMGDEDGIMEPA